MARARGPGAPLSGLFAKTQVAYALGIISEETRGLINRIRNIRNVFAHRFAPSDVVDPVGVEDDVRNLSGFVILYFSEHSEEKRYSFYNKLIVTNIDTIANVVRVLDEEEDAGSKNLLGSNREDER